MSQRTEKVSSIILKQLNTLIRTDYQAECVPITFMRVTVSPDLRNATAFYSIIGGERERKDAARFFKGNGHDLRVKLKPHLTMKYTPFLLFKFDENVDKLNRVMSILDQVEGSDSPNDPQA